MEMRKKGKIKKCQRITSAHIKFKRQKEEIDQRCYRNKVVKKLT